MPKPTPPSFRPFIRRLIKALASLKLAVLVILSLGAMTAWGTFVEAEFDATAAQKLVYHSPWMYAIMGLFAINLIAVMADRWPWEARHTGFIFAHIGLLILMIGSVTTRYYGVDGSMTIAIGETQKSIVVPETDLTLYSSFDGTRYTKIDDREVDFFLNRPTREKPYEVRIPAGVLRVVDYMPYAFREQKIVATQDEKAGAAVRFQLQNDRVNVTDWLLQPGPARDALKDLGPAQVVLAGSGPFAPAGRNSVVLRAHGPDALEYEIHTARDPKNVKKGVVKSGETVETGWMGLVLRVLKYMPRASEEVSFKKAERPTELTSAAILVDYNGKERWMSVDSMIKLFTDDSVYVLRYASRSLDLGIPIKVKDFHVGRYQGTMRAATYESVVEVPGIGERVISMNEPLKHGGYTFYQSSFRSDDNGRPQATIFSVNRDPGRWLKYLGCLLIVLGSIHLFYFKRSRMKRAADLARASGDGEKAG